MKKNFLILIFILLSLIGNAQIVSNLPTEVGKFTAFRNNPITFTINMPVDYTIPTPVTAETWDNLLTRNQKVASATPTTNVIGQVITVSYTASQIRSLAGINRFTFYVIFNSDNDSLRKYVMGGVVTVSSNLGIPSTTPITVNISDVGEIKVNLLGQSSLTQAYATQAATYAANAASSSATAITNATTATTQAGNASTSAAASAASAASIDPKVALRTPYGSMVKLRATPDTSYKSFYINDKGKEGTFRYNSSSSAADDSAMVIISGGRRYERVFDESIYPEWWGAIPDGTTDNYIAIQKTLNYASNSGGKKVVFRTGTYLTSKKLVIKPIPGNLQYTYNQAIQGISPYTCIIKGTETFAAGDALLEAASGETDFTANYGRDNKLEIKNLVLEARGASKCLFLNFTAGVYVDDCKFLGGMDYCVQVGSDDGPTRNYSLYFRRNYHLGVDKNFGQNKGTLIMKYGFFVDIDRMETDGGQYGVKMENCVSTVLTNSKLEGVKGSIIHITGDAVGQHRITGNYLFAYGLYDPNGRFDGNAYGIYINSTGSGSNATNIISNNTITVDHADGWPRVLTYTAKSSSLTYSSSGHIITGSTSGATGYLQSIVPTVPEDGTGKLLVQKISGTFQAGENFTQAVSGGTGTIGTITPIVTYGVYTTGTYGGTNYTGNTIAGYPSYGMYLNTVSNNVVSNGVTGDVAVWTDKAGVISGNTLDGQTTTINNVGALASQFNNTRMGAGAFLGTTTDNHIPATSTFSTLEASAVKFTGSPVPKTGGAYDLGTAALYFNNMFSVKYTGTIYQAFNSSGVIFANSSGVQYYRMVNGSGNSIFGAGNPTDYTAAGLQLASTTKGALLAPMTTAQRDNIESPPEGLEIYNLTTHTKNFWNGTVWKAVTTD